MTAALLRAGGLFLLALIGAPALVYGQPASRPASAPASRGAPPTSAATGAGTRPSGSERIADPLDDDDDDEWPGARKGAASKPTAAALPSLSSRLRWRASALLRVATDLSHDSPASKAPGASSLFREDVLDVYGGAWANLAYRVSKRLRLVVGARLYFRLTTRRPEQPGERFNGFNGELHRTDFEALPGDSFIEWSPVSWLDLRLGTQTLVWGKNDLVNPNEVLTARDLRLGLLTDAEATRLPTFGISADIFAGGFQLTAVWQPLFWSQRVDVFGSDYALFGPGVPQALSGFGALVDGLLDDSVEGQVQESLLATARPRPVAGSTLALRVSRTVAGWDLAAQYVWGYQRVPVLRVRKDFALALAPIFLRPDPTLTADDIAGLASFLRPGSALPLEQTFARAHQAGLALSKALWRLVFDVDVSFVSARPEVLSGGGLLGLPLIDAGGDWLTVARETSTLAYTVGARYAAGEEILIKVEWWHELLLGLLDEGEQLLLGGAQRGGLALLFQFLWRRIDLTGQLLIHAELFNRSLVFSPQLAYRLHAHVTLLAGANVFVGQRGPGALLGVNDQLFLALKAFL